MDKKDEPKAMHRGCSYYASYHEEAGGKRWDLHDSSEDSTTCSNCGKHTIIRTKHYVEMAELQEYRAYCQKASGHTDPHDPDTYYSPSGTSKWEETGKERSETSSDCGCG